MSDELKQENLTDKQKKKTSKVVYILLNHIEYFFLFFLALLALWLVVRVGNFSLLYNRYALGVQLLQFSGVLFGLLLTAYAMFLNLIPSPSLEKSVLRTKAFKKTHLNFTLALLVTLAIIIISFCIIFATGGLQQDLIYFQLLFLFIALELAIVLTIALSYLFRYMINRTANC